MSRSSDGLRLWTVGHSTRSFEELCAVLESPEVGPIEVLADIRTAPRSRRHPHFNLEALAEELPRRGLEYVHLKRLGGFRRPRPDSQNGAWRNESFRGYADYLETAEFASALDELFAIARRARTAVMCSEGVPWRCHRSLLADALRARGVDVTHLLSATKAQGHALTSFAVVEGERVTYPAAEEPVEGEADVSAAV
ncbi:MAG TPA: DUF488 domain-containing protein [Dehalococcoidia bacterium]|nr:DUF488 domain-containing protein [Dehalococcoidia bacterium]